MAHSAEKPVRPLAVAMPERQLFSVNQFKTWTKCQKKYYYDYVRKLRWPSDQSRFAFGKTIHKLFEYQARNLPFDALLQNADPAIQTAWQTLMEHPIPHFPILGSEWAFTVPVAGQWITGRIDRLAKQDEMILILDWKTGTSIPSLPEVDWQTVIYQYAVVEAHQQLGLSVLPPEHVRFVYLEIKGDIRELMIPYGPQKHQETRQRIEEVLGAVQQEKTYPLPPKCPDPFCPYLNICGISSAMPEVLS